jgi:branched-chain amino acid transport system ATP-binding protein
MLLKVVNLTSTYSEVPAITGINLNIDYGEIVTIIGSNGSGKSTLLKSITGHLTPTNGKIFYESKNITKFMPWELIEIGIVLVPEGRHLFSGLTVEENLWLGTFPLRKKIKKNGKKILIEYIYDIFPILGERRKQIAHTLSGGEQQMLAVGRGLVAKPKLLILDEPSLGLAPIVKSEIFEILRKINHERKATILLVEQDVKAALAIADRGYLMQAGKIVIEDTSNLLRENDEVTKIYLGKNKEKIQ